MNSHVSLDDRRAMGRWNSGSMERSYISSVNQNGVANWAGFKSLSHVYLPRDSVVPPECLQKQIFPQLEAIEESFQKMLPSDPDKHISADGFLKLMKWLRVVLLQDVCFLELKSEFSGSDSNPIFSNKVFLSEEFNCFKNELLMKANSTSNPSITNLEGNLPGLVDALGLLEKKISTNDSNMNYRHDKLEAKFKDAEIVAQTQTTLLISHGNEIMRQGNETSKMLKNMEILIQSKRFEYENKIREAEKFLDVSSSQSIPPSASLLSTSEFRPATSQSQPESSQSQPAYPQYKFLRSNNVSLLWDEYFVGVHGQLPVRRMEFTFQQDKKKNYRSLQSERTHWRRNKHLFFIMEEWKKSEKIKEDFVVNLKAFLEKKNTSLSKFKEAKAMLEEFQPRTFNGEITIDLNF